MIDNNFNKLLAEQVKHNWKNYKTLRIDLSIARTKELFNMAGKYICVQDVSSRNVIATIILNEKENDPLNLKNALEIETFFKEFYITNTAQAGQWIDLIIGADFAYKKKMRLNYIKRPDDPAVYDYTLPNFTCDNAWHYLALPATAAGFLVPTDAQLIHFNLNVNCTVNNQLFCLGFVGQINLMTTAYIFTHLANLTVCLDCWVQPSSNLIQYIGNPGPWNTINLVVKGWLV